jgi:hypothetical protein
MELCKISPSSPFFNENNKDIIYTVVRRSDDLVNLQYYKHEDDAYFSTIIIPEKDIVVIQMDEYSSKLYKMDEYGLMDELARMLGISSPESQEEKNMSSLYKRKILRRAIKELNYLWLGDKNEKER